MITKNFSQSDQKVVSLAYTCKKKITLYEGHKKMGQKIIHFHSNHFVSSHLGLLKDVSTYQWETLRLFLQTFWTGGGGEFARLST